MRGPDLNLLLTLDVLLQQGSVAGAGRKLGLSPSAMSRALARLRAVTGDPLLVRAGRGLVPTLRADQIRDEVRRLVEDAHALLRPTHLIDLASMSRTFVLRASDGFVETFGPILVQRISEEAPNARIRFTRKFDKDSAGLREGDVDLETGVVGKMISPEVRAQALFSDRYVGVVRAGHPLSERKMTAARYAEGRHVQVSRPGLDLGAIDETLSQIGMTRRVVTTVDGFAAALALARGSDLIATIPEWHTLGIRSGMTTFALPFETVTFTISLLWHPRMDGDPAHRWLRQCVRQSCLTLLGNRAID